MSAHITSRAPCRSNVAATKISKRRKERISSFSCNMTEQNDPGIRRLVPSNRPRTSVMVMKSGPDCQTFLSRGTTKCGGETGLLLLLLLLGGRAAWVVEGGWPPWHSGTQNTAAFNRITAAIARGDKLPRLALRPDGRVKNISNNDAYKLQLFDAFGLRSGEEN